MLIERTSMISRITRTRDLDITAEQVERYFNTHDLIQDVFPNLSASDREFFKTGITDDEWDSMFMEK